MARRSWEQMVWVGWWIQTGQRAASCVELGSGLLILVDCSGWCCRPLRSRMCKHYRVWVRKRQCIPKCLSPPRSCWRYIGQNLGLSLLCYHFCVVVMRFCVFFCSLVTFPLSSPGCRSFPGLSPALGKNDFSFPDILLMLEKKSRSFYPPHVSNPSPPPPPLLPPPLHWCGCKQSRVRQWCWCVVAGMWLLCLFATALIAHSDRSSVTECVCVHVCLASL